MSNRLPHFAYESGRLLNLNDSRVDELQRTPSHSAREDMDGLRPSRPRDGHTARSRWFRLRIAADSPDELSAPAHVAWLTQVGISDTTRQMLSYTGPPQR